MVAFSQRFTPPFCPNPSCEFHRKSRGWHFVRWGSYTRTLPRVRDVPRYRCSLCRRTFSRQTFQTSYWLRRPELIHTILERLLSGSGFHQIARFLERSGCEAGIGFLGSARTNILQGTINAVIAGARLLAGSGIPTGA